MAQNMRNLDEARKPENIQRMGEQATEAATSTIEKGKEKVAEWGHEAAAAAGNIAGRAQEMTSQAYEAVKDRTHELTSAAAHYAEDYGKEVSALIRRYPLQTLAAGMLVGFLLGKVIDLRRS